MKLRRSSNHQKCRNRGQAVESKQLSNEVPVPTWQVGGTASGLAAGFITGSWMLLTDDHFEPWLVASIVSAVAAVLVLTVPSSWKFVPRKVALAIAIGSVA